jgi:hypothetical protein
VHGPIGPPKRNEAAEQSSAAGGGDLLGRFWATAANGSPEPIKSGKANLAVQEDQLRKLSLTGGHGKEGLGLHHQRTYGFSPDQSKSKVSKPPGFFGERDQNTGVPSDPSTLNRFSDLQGVSKGALTWEKGTGGLKQESRPSDDRGESFLGDGWSHFYVFFMWEKRKLKGRQMCRLLDGYVAGVQIQVSIRAGLLLQGEVGRMVFRVLQGLLGKLGMIRPTWPLLTFQGMRAAVFEFLGVEEVVGVVVLGEQRWDAQQGEWVLGSG